MSGYVSWWAPPTGEVVNNSTSRPYIHRELIITETMCIERYRDPSMWCVCVSRYLFFPSLPPTLTLLPLSLSLSLSLPLSLPLPLSLSLSLPLSPLSPCLPCSIPDTHAHRHTRRNTYTHMNSWHVIYVPEYNSFSSFHTTHTEAGRALTNQDRCSLGGRIDFHHTLDYRDMFADGAC